MAAQSTHRAQPDAGASSEDLYHILGVAPDAEREVIDAAYRALARKYHPDVNRDPDAHGRMQTINDAYAVLRDPARRAAYDGTRVPVAQSTTVGGADGVSPPRFREVVGEAWRGWRTRAARESARRFAVGAGGMVLLALLLVGGLAGWRAWQDASGTGSAREYWRTAGAARGQVEAARRDFEATRGSGGLAAAAGNAQFAATAARLAAELDAAVAQLKGAKRIPAEAEAYHFAQLQDWQAERTLVLAYRDAAVTRNADLWTRTAEVEAAWRASPEHQQTEALAKQHAPA